MFYIVFIFFIFSKKGLSYRVLIFLLGILQNFVNVFGGVGGDVWRWLCRHVCCKFTLVTMGGQAEIYQFKWSIPMLYSNAQFQLPIPILNSNYQLPIAILNYSSQLQFSILLLNYKSNYQFQFSIPIMLRQEIEIAASKNPCADNKDNNKQNKVGRMEKMKTNFLWNLRRIKKKLLFIIA